MVRRIVGNIDLVAGTLTTVDGRVFTLDDIPGNGWNSATRRERLAEAIQALVDEENTFTLTSLPSDDPDKTATAAELFAEYGNRVFLDGNGNIVHRTSAISFDWDGTDLIPITTTVR